MRNYTTLDHDCDKSDSSGHWRYNGLVTCQKNRTLRNVVCFIIGEEEVFRREKTEDTIRN